MQTPVSSQTTVVVLARKRKVSPEITATRSDWYTFCFLAGLCPASSNNVCSVLLICWTSHTLVSNFTRFPSFDVGIEDWHWELCCLLSKLYWPFSDSWAKLWLSSSTNVLAQPASRPSTALLDSLFTTAVWAAKSCASKYSRYSCVRHSMAERAPLSDSLPPWSAVVNQLVRFSHSLSESQMQITLLSQHTTVIACKQNVDRFLSCFRTYDKIQSTFRCLPEVHLVDYNFQLTCSAKDWSSLLSLFFSLTSTTSFVQGRFQLLHNHLQHATVSSVELSQWIQKNPVS